MMMRALESGGHHAVSWRVHPVQANGQSLCREQQSKSPERRWRSPGWLCPLDVVVWTSARHLQAFRRPQPARCRIHALALRPPPATRHAQHPLEVYAAAVVLEEEEGRLAGRTTQPKLPSGGATGDALRRIVTSIVRLPRGHLGVRRHLLRLLPMDGPPLRRRAMAARPLLLANHRHLPVRV